MKHILSPRHRHLLGAFALDGTVLAFDFDGTLAPITADRDAAQMRPSTRELLAQVCARHPVAIVSGRSLADLAARLSGVDRAHLVGNHGIEPGVGIDAFVEGIAAARAFLLHALAERKDIDIEDKTYSLAVHYRRARQPNVARRAILQAIATLPTPLRVVGGKLVINGLPPAAPNKGNALRVFCERMGADAALYVGDDVTDEDVFVVERPSRLLSIRVGRSVHSAARYYLQDQVEVDALLIRLLDPGAVEGQR